MSVKSLQDAFVDELKDMYDAERRIIKALPKLAKRAESEELTSAFEEHLEQTKEHVERLDQIFEGLGKAPGRKICQGMVGVLAEGDKVMEEAEEGPALDAMLICAAQKVEHYEIATYGCLREWAQILGEDDASRLLQQTLDEEGEADKKLTQIAQSLNFEAAQEEEESEEEEETTTSRTRARTTTASRRR
jgi:ferritin-like metal-binding protein YciE